MTHCRPNRPQESPELALRRQLRWIEDDVVFSLFDVPPAPVVAQANASHEPGRGGRWLARCRDWWRRQRQARTDSHRFERASAPRRRPT